LRRLIVGLLLAAACAQGNGAVVGVVTAVEGDLVTVTSFTILVEGEQMVFVPDPDGDYAFPLPHLREHLRDGSPVRVVWERRDDRRVALSVEDG
jgi:hypothetical protein